MTYTPLCSCTCSRGVHQGNMASAHLNGTEPGTELTGSHSMVVFHTTGAAKTFVKMCCG